MKRARGIRCRCSIARASLCADAGPQPSRAAICRSCSGRRKMSAGVAISPARVELAHRAFAQPLDVESGARGEVDQPLLDLRAAGEPAGAAPHRLARIAHGGAAANRAMVGKDVGQGFRRSALRHRSQDLRNDVARALQHHGVANANILAGDFVLVVQRGPRHKHAADIDRLQRRDRRQRAGTADLDQNVLQNRRRLLGGKLPGDGPARFAAGETKSGLQRQVIDLVHHAIDVVRQRRALGRDVGLEGFGLGLAAQQPAQRIDGKSPAAQALQEMPVRVGELFAGLAQRIGEQQQPAARRDARVELAQAAGRGIARIGEQPLSGLLLRRVECQEIGLGHEDLAADFDARGRVAGKPARHGIHRQQIGGDGLALAAVAARAAHDQPAMLVGERDRQSVDLRLGHEPQAVRCCPGTGRCGR